MYKKKHPVVYEIEFRARLLQKRLVNAEILPEDLIPPVINPWGGIAPVQLRDRAAVGPYPKSILFLCSDNLTRGPLAEALFLQLLYERSMEDQWFVRSGRVDILNDELFPMDERVIQYLAQKDIYPGHHQSKTVTRADFTHFNIIICFDEAERHFAEQISPKSCIPRIQLLGKFHPSGELNFVGSKNKEGFPLEGSESKKWISCEEWRKTHTLINSKINSEDLEDIAILYDQCHLCCSRILDYYLKEAIPNCLCIYKFQHKQFKAYNPDKMFSVYSDKIIIKDDEGNEIKKKDAVDKQKLAEDILNYYATNQICTTCWKKTPPKNLDKGASSSKTT